MSDDRDKKMEDMIKFGSPVQGDPDSPEVGPTYGVGPFTIAGLCETEGTRGELWTPRSPGGKRNT